MGHSCDNGRDSQSYRAQANGGLRKRNVSSAVRTTQGVVSSSPPQPPPVVARPTPGRNMSMEANISEHRSRGQRTVIDRKASAKQKYALLPDNFTTLETKDYSDDEEAEDDDDIDDEEDEDEVDNELFQHKKRTGGSELVHFHDGKDVWLLRLCCF